MDDRTEMGQSDFRHIYLICYIAYLLYHGVMLGGDLVREARRRAGLTQAELAEKAETTQSAIARLEAGRTSPSFDLVLRLLKLCGFRLDVSLDPYDDSDLAQAEALLRRSVDERVEWLEDFVRSAEEMRQAYLDQIGA
jgi:transcriptional regulator with XRE-family HTH domain